MRKKITKLPIRKSNILPKEIITFDNQDFNASLLESATKRLTNFQTFTRNAQILRASAAQANTFCLANNQIMGEQRILAINLNPIKDMAHKNSVKWISQDYNQPQQYEIYGDPEILQGEDLVEEHEESISLPFLNFYVKRYRNITVKYKNHLNIREEKRLEGYPSYALQQGLQQLNGTILFDWRVNHGKMYFQKEAAEYFPKSSAIIEEYVKDLKKVFEEYPQLIAKKDRITAEDKGENKLHTQILPFEIDCFRRLVRHYGKEMELLPQKLEAKRSGAANRAWKDQDLKVKIIKQ